ncbi:MAG: type II toxin-antitoxin system RelE family toxin [Rhodospirillales bacterium]
MWSIAYTGAALATLAGINRTVAKRIRAKVLDLARDPRAPNNNVKKLTGVEGYRLRVGDWRVIYALRQQVFTIVVVRVGHRSEIYE